MAPRRPSTKGAAPKPEAPEGTLEPVPVDHAAFGDLLVEYARANKLPAEVAADERFAEYLAALAQTDVDGPTGDARLALLLNAHSAFTIASDALSDRAYTGELGGKKWSLAGLESEAMTATSDPRVVFCLARADATGPLLRPGAYVSDRLSKQIEEDASVFIRGIGRPEVDSDYGVLYLSPVFRLGPSGPMEEETAVWLVRQSTSDATLIDLIDGGDYSVEFEEFSAPSPLQFATSP